MSWEQAKEQLREQLSHIRELVTEPVEPQNEVQHLAGKTTSILENIVSLLCVLTLLTFGIVFIFQHFLPELLNWFIGTHTMNNNTKIITLIRLIIVTLVILAFLTRFLLSIALFIKSYYLGSIVGLIFFLVVLAKIFKAAIGGVSLSEIFQEYIPELLKTSIGA